MSKKRSAESHWVGKENVAKAPNPGGESRERDSFLIKVKNR